MSGQFLATSRYAPGTQTTFTVSTTTLAAYGSGTISTPTFTAPASGNVLITVNAMFVTSAAGVYYTAALAQSGSITPLSDIIQSESPSAGFALQTALPFMMSGLTAGSAYTFDLVGSATSGQTAAIWAYTQTVTNATLGATGKGAPVVVTVQAV